MFRYKDGIPLSYNRQGYIYFASLRYGDMSQAQRRRIETLCLEAAGGRDNYALALLKFVTTKSRAEHLEREYGINRKTLYRYVREYYIRFPKWI